MKKIFLIFLVSLTLLFIFSNTVLAENECTVDPKATGIVPCGVSKDSNGMPTCPCNISFFFVMLARIYDFLVKYIATTLATIMIIVGAVFMMISAGNPSLAGTGRKMVYSAIIGMILVFGSWLIVNALLELIGYTPPSGVNWYSLP
jgi:hypothetical protein